MFTHLGLLVLCSVDSCCHGGVDLELVRCGGVRCRVRSVALGVRGHHGVGLCDHVLLDGHWRFLYFAEQHSYHEEADGCWEEAW